MVLDSVCHTCSVEHTVSVSGQQSCESVVLQFRDLRVTVFCLVYCLRYPLFKGDSAKIFGESRHKVASI